MNDPGFVSMTQVAYAGIRRRAQGPGCDAGSHTLAFATTDRTGAKVWVCRACPAVREFGDPTWRTP